MSNISALDNLPAIDMLKEEGITFESIANEMIADYQARYEELTGEALELYPADSRRILINTTAGKLYQLAAIMNERHKLNFIQYMYGPFLKNWGANFGFVEDGTEAAQVTLRFTLSAVQPQDITIPAGTRATCGDQIYFATDEDLVIPAGSEYGDTNATCTEVGTKGNGYIEGQLNIISDPVNLVESVSNTTESAGGHDEYTDEELRELIFNFSNTYSSAGPIEAYEEFTKAYSSNIIDAKVITDHQATVKIYILLQNGILPTAEYLENVYEYVKGLNKTPDTDKIEMYAPTQVGYTLEATYYISEDKKEIADGIKEAIEDSVNEFVNYTKSKIGRAINPDILRSYVNAAGGSRIVITAPEYEAIEEDEVAVCENISLTFGGYDKE